MIDSEAIRKRAKDCLTGHAGPTIANNVFAVDVPALLSHIAALEAAHEAELLSFARFIRYRIPGLNPFGMTDSQILTAYRAQKEKASVSSATTHPATQANATAGER